MKVLDCESVESTYSSLEMILSISKDKIRERLLSFDYENCDCEYGEKVFLKLFQPDFEKIRFDRTCWFHATRMFPNQSYAKNGILPLGSAIENIWENLFDLVKEAITLSEWDEFKASVEKDFPGQDAYAYRLKLEHDHLGGPFGFMSRDIIFRSKEVGNHDYLAESEIVRDICRCFYQKFRVGLLKKYISNTKRCIVKFFAPEVKLDYLEGALYFLYLVERKEELNIGCNRCFDGGGNEISPECVLRVEVLD